MNEREEVLRRIAKGRCQCTAYGCHEGKSRCNKKLTIAFIAYKMPVEMGGREHIENMAALCGACYSTKTERDSRNIEMWLASRRQENRRDV